VLRTSGTPVPSYTNEATDPACCSVTTINTPELRGLNRPGVAYSIGKSPGVPSNVMIHL